MFIEMVSRMMERPSPTPGSNGGDIKSKKKLRAEPRKVLRASNN
jgi:hypothetical protein